MMLVMMVNTLKMLIIMLIITIETVIIMIMIMSMMSTVIIRVIVLRLQMMYVFSKKPSSRPSPNGFLDFGRVLALKISYKPKQHVNVTSHQYYVEPGNIFSGLFV